MGCRVHLTQSTVFVLAVSAGFSVHSMELVVVHLLSSYETAKGGFGSDTLCHADYSPAVFSIN